MARKVLIALRRGTEAALPNLAVGELGFTTDTMKLYIGTDSGNQLLVAAQTVGDMLKSIYDTDGDGVVDVAESVPWAGVTGKPSTYTPSSHNHTQLQKIDDRDAKPNVTAKGYLQLFFTSLAGMTGAANSDYQDMLVLNSYGDTSGGLVNALLLDKSEKLIRHYQAGQTDTTWGTPKILAYQEDTMKKGPVTWNDLKGV